MRSQRGSMIDAVSNHTQKVGIVGRIIMWARRGTGMMCCSDQKYVSLALKVRESPGGVCVLAATRRGSRAGSGRVCRYSTLWTAK